jgi:hypothetical protein
VTECLRLPESWLRELELSRTVAATTYFFNLRQGRHARPAGRALAPLSIYIRHITNLPPKLFVITNLPPILFFITNLPPKNEAIPNSYWASHNLNVACLTLLPYLVTLASLPPRTSLLPSMPVVPCNSCRAGGQQEGLQYNGEVAWGKVIVIYPISAVLGSSEETQACLSEEVLTSLFIIFLQHS